MYYTEKDFCKDFFMNTALALFSTVLYIMNATKSFKQGHYKKAIAEAFFGPLVSSVLWTIAVGASYSLMELNEKSESDEALEITEQE